MGRKPLLVIRLGKFVSPTPHTPLPHRDEPEAEPTMGLVYSRTTWHGVGLPMSEVTRILSAIERGDPSAAEQLLPLVYDELRKLAAQKLALEKPGQTLQATALVHEGYLRLVDVKDAQDWGRRGHFFAAAAEAMRRILIDHARRQGRYKHGKGRQRVELMDAAAPPPADDLLALDEALTRLAAEDPVAARVVELRHFAGLGHEEIAGVLGITVYLARQKWTYARAWLRHALGD
jgi:RNA polymerase sigma factor (TIGR02999 family)